MTNSNTTSSSTSTSTSTSSTGSAAKQAKVAAKPAPKATSGSAVSNRSSGRRWLSRLLSLALLAGLGGAGYYYAMPLWQQVVGQQQGLARQVEALEAALAEQAKQQREQAVAVANHGRLLDSLPVRLSGELSGQLSEQLARQVTGPVANLSAAVQRNQRRLNDLDGNVGRQWQLAELQYIVHIAGQRLAFEPDTAPSVALLERADTLLAGWNDPALAPLRAGLAADIAALQALPVIDREGLANRLMAVAEQVQMALQSGFVELAFEPEPPMAAPVDWRGRVAELGELVGQLFILKRSDAPLPVVVAAQQPELVALRFAQAIEQAQLALWRGDQSRYQHSLALCTELLAIGGVTAGPLIDALAQLAAEPVAAPALPPSRAEQALYDWQQASGVLGREAGVQP